MQLLHSVLESGNQLQTISVWMGALRILQKQAASPCQDWLLSLRNQVCFFWCHWISLKKNSKSLVMAYKTLPDQTPAFLFIFMTRWTPCPLLPTPPHLPPPILNPAKRLAVLRFCTPVLISKVSPELDSSLVQKPGKFSHFHQLLQNSQGVHVTLFTFTTVMSMLSSASFSRYSECTFSTSAGFPNTSWSLYEQPRCSFDSSASFISIANQRTSSNKFAFWIVLKYNLSSFLIGLMVISHLDYPQSMPIGLCQLSLTSLTHPPTYSFICLSTYPFNPLILSAIHSHTHSSFDLSTYPSIHSSILPEYLFCTRWGK